MKLAKKPSEYIYHDFIRLDMRMWTLAFSTYSSTERTKAKLPVEHMVTAEDRLWGINTCSM